MSHQPPVLTEDPRGRALLRFDRTLHHPVEQVWAALTRVSDMEAWHPTPFHCEPVLGAPLEYVSADAPQSDEVLAYEPNARLAHTWDGDKLEWEVSQAGVGTRLVLMHTFDDRAQADDHSARWEQQLAALEGVLSGERRPGPARVAPA